MRIVYVQQHFATEAGAAGVRGWNLARTLAGRGHDVTVICGHNWRDPSLAGDPRQLVEIRAMDGFRVIRLGIFYSNHQSVIRRLLSFAGFAFLASREVARQPADVVFASSTPLTVSVPAVWGRVWRGVPYVFEVRDLWPDLPIEMGLLTNPVITRILYWWERYVYRRAWRVVALAPGIRNAVIAKAGRDPAHVIMIPNGCDTVSVRPVARTTPRLLPGPVDDGVLVLGYTGTLGWANGLDAVLDAAAVLKRRGSRRARFVLIGDGREQARLQKRVEVEGLDTVTFAGLFAKGDYNRVLAELDVGMQILRDVPGFYYGTSPNKFFDYLAAGRPVLVNYPGWMRDLVIENGCGLAVPPGDPEAFADAVEAMAADRDGLARMGHRARALAEGQFSHQRILVELAEFLEEHEHDARRPLRAAVASPEGPKP